MEEFIIVDETTGVIHYLGGLESAKQRLAYVCRIVGNHGVRFLSSEKHESDYHGYKLASALEKEYDWVDYTDMIANKGNMLNIIPCTEEFYYILNLIGGKFTRDINECIRFKYVGKLK